MTKCTRQQKYFSGYDNREGILLNDVSKERMEAWSFMEVDNQRSHEERGQTASLN
jgi:hypothetical protein